MIEFIPLPLVPTGAVLVEAGTSLEIPYGMAHAESEVELWKRCCRTFIVVPRPGAQVRCVGGYAAMLRPGVYDVRITRRDGVPA